jgi:hypothetical protein
MAIPARFLRFVAPALVSAGLALAACSSDSDDPAPGTNEPGEGGSDSSGGGTGGTSSGVAGEAGTPPVTGGTAGAGATGTGGEPDPGTGGTPTEPEPGTAGAGGTDEGPPEPTPGFLHGKELYEPCAVCHQVDLGGTGIFPNISMDTVNGIGSWTDAEIGKAIVEGIGKDGDELCSLMDPQENMSEGDLADLIEYLRGMPANDRKITSECPL